MTIDNRDRFKKSPHAKAWGQLTASEMFVEASNASILILVAQQNPDAAAANSYRLEGARQVLGIMLNLTTEKKESKLEDQNLKTNI